MERFPASRWGPFNAPVLLQASSESAPDPFGVYRRDSAHGLPRRALLTRYLWSGIWQRRSGNFYIDFYYWYRYMGGLPARCYKWNPWPGFPYYKHRGA